MTETINLPFITPLSAIQTKFPAQDYNMSSSKSKILISRPVKQNLHANSNLISFFARILAIHNQRACQQCKFFKVYFSAMTVILGRAELPGRFKKSKLKN